MDKQEYLSLLKEEFTNSCDCEPLKNLAPLFEKKKNLEKLCFDLMQSLNGDDKLNPELRRIFKERLEDFYDLEEAYMTEINILVEKGKLNLFYHLYTKKGKYKQYPISQSDVEYVWKNKDIVSYNCSNCNQQWEVRDSDYYS